ncbi:hypothetical protein ABCR94_24960 [Streptomyces sp. 21So2-11]|uniref:hypothetical protein n=1 Tax=Streptomyces sp. 21So2-11 TaxID=3144408 RepID=UPI00321AC082
MCSATPDPEEGCEIEALATLIEAGGFWRLAPEWVPQAYADPSPDVLNRVGDGLRQLIA